MKGDFTRSTFQPNKHYTSVRMQQGRLQLDSDWNEQVDIEAYLRHAQAVDMIGADSGVPTSKGDSAEPYRDSFKISVTPDGSDLAIAPGRLYANGTFCELEATPLEGTFTASNRIQVNTLIADGRQLEKSQWIEIAPENNPDLKASVQIAEVNIQTLELTLNLDSEKIKADLLKVKDYTEKVENKSQGLRLRRVVTYNTQPDYIKPEERLTQNTIYLVYVDVWQRHITAIEDPTIREVALNGSDTTTRTQTIWQIKLKKLDELIKEVGGEAEDKNAFPENKQLNNLNDPDWESLIQKVWGKFLTQQEQRQALMNACAKLCSSSGSQSNGSGYQRLENLLYRVEIYEPSQTEQGENQGNNRTNKATFKWSRDNGSVVSPIEKIEGNVITIRKSSQDAWMSSRAGQWLEITNEEMELKGQPGVMVPLSRVSDSKIEFNDSRIVNGPIPNNSTKVRLWSHDVKKYPNGAVPIADDWIELEPGIKVKFYKDSDYRTGDYWLIPARNATNDIEWPHNQAELQKRQPLPQPPKGIHHDYCPLALIQFEGQVNAEEDKSEQEEPEEEPKNIRDLRVIFPPLMRCLDKAGGVITGTLEVQSDLYVTGRYQKQVDRYVDGKVGIGTKQPFARLHTKAAKLLPGQEQITSHEQQINLHEASNFTTKFHEGDLLKVDGQERIITQVEDKFLTINETLEITEPKSFEYQQPIARLENSDGNPQFVVLANGNTGIGTPTPYNQLDVVGGVAIGQAYAGETKAPDNGLLVDGTVSIGSTLPSDATNFKLYVNGNIKGNSITAKSGIFRSQEGANLSFQTGDTTRISVASRSGNVGIGIDPNNEAKLHVAGSLKLTNNLQSATVSFTNDQWLQFAGTNLTGYSFDLPLKAQQGVVTNHIENYNGQSLILQTNNQDRIAIAHDTGHVGITSNVGIGLSNPTQKLIVENGKVGIGYNDSEQSAMLAVKETVGIGITKPNAQLHVVGTVQVDAKTDANTLIRLTQDNQSVNINWQDDELQFVATSLTGYSFDQQIKTQKGIVTNRIENHTNENLILQTQNQNLILRTNNQDRITIDQDGKVGIGTPDSPSQLDINGTAKAIQLEGSSLKLNNLTVNQFSNESNLTDDEQSVPTEKAVKAYIDGEITKVQVTLADKADRTEVETEINALRTELQTSLNQEVTQVQTTLADKAARNGNLKEDFNAKKLYVNTSIYAKSVDTETIDSKTVASVKTVSNGFYQVSSRALKEDINDLSSQEVAAILRALNPVKFIYTEDESKTPHAGFIAEDTPELLTSNEKQSIKVVDIVAVLTKVVQDHRKTLTDLVKVVRKQQSEIAALTQKLQELEEKKEP